VTVHERVASARSRLVAAGLTNEEADRDARLLARFVLGWDAARFWTEAGGTEPPGFHPDYERLVERRAGREPVAYITGRQEFWGLSFEVTPAVLIPRPETELIVESALQILPGPAVEIDIADVGTGSGCLAVALARELPRARIVATDISPDALELARRNARRHDVLHRIEFLHTDLLNGLDRVFQLIVCNPPYVPEADKPGLQPEVRDCEPQEALFAGDSGMAVISRLVEQAPRFLRPGGLLLFELGWGQAEAVKQMITGTPGLIDRGIRQDLQGIPRTAIVQSQGVER
jgi:release factor glutamine methyltransferase